jgi:hypothetical protein
MSNKKRLLAQVLSIDAWHEPMKFDGRTFSVHVELSFKNGRIGGDDPRFPFTFKRALLTIQLEKPLSIDRKSVARHIPSNQAELTQIIAARDEIKSSREFGGKVSPAALAFSISGKAENTDASSREKQMKVVQEVPRIVAIPHPLGSQEYAWELRPGQSPVAEPRLSAKITSGGKPKIEPVLKALVTCKLEDIEISDLVLKDTSPVGILKEMAFHRVNMVAAIQHLKFSLREMELEAGDFGDKFSAVTIADMIVLESSDE